MPNENSLAPDRVSDPNGKSQKGKEANRRNGSNAKTLRSDLGPLEIEVPRDRQGEFEPKIVPKGFPARFGTLGLSLEGSWEQKGLQFLTLQDAADWT